MTATELKPRIRPVYRFDGGFFMWECRAQRLADRDGWVYAETYGKKGHGYTPDEAYNDWKAQQTC